MHPEATQFLRSLLECPTPSGYEVPGQRVVREYIARYSDEVLTDVQGNVHGIVNRGGKIRVMLAGHCDEIGLMVMHVDEKGFVYVAAVGGLHTPLLHGERVTIHGRKGPVAGVVGSKPIHLMDEKERNSAPSKIHELWIDIGAKNRKDALDVVEPGDVATVNAGWTELRNGLVACRAFDDRIGAFIVADVLRLLRGKRFAAEVHAVSTVQEEIGLRGAHTAAYGIDPHVGIAVEVGHATDIPNGEPKRVGEAKLGQGPILHRGPNFNHTLYDLLVAAGKKAKIKTQLQPIPRGSGTDANIIQLTRSGVAAGLVSVPTRYMHTPVETIALKDVEDCISLITQFILDLRPDQSFIPGFTPDSSAPSPATRHSSKTPRRRGAERKAKN